ncbi:MAG: Eco57I restriction-modification methylase domain-containing protein, partial [Lewinella sp.]|nr:Eco57I restriction-modification methylase domain-containing protein [Lewinella sp.]
MSFQQMQFDFVASVPLQAELISAVEAMAEAGVEDRGAIFTRRSVVDFILDLTGYTSDKPLYKTRLLEPAFGNGDFLLPAVKRLLDSLKGSQNGEEPDFAKLDGCLCAVELHIPTFENTKAKLLALLTDNDIPKPVAIRLVEGWLIQNDFLLTEFSGRFDFVAGNPPYVRQERISDVLLSAYRKRFSTLYDRADLYVPFIECSLKLLKKGGTLGFICSDRWMKNRYGGPLREMISRDYHLKVYVDMMDTDAFHSDVTAYPAITIVSRQAAGATRIAHRPEIDAAVFRKLAKELSAPKLSGSVAVREIKGVTNGKEPWILDSSDQLAVIRRLEQSFPTLEEAGCKVGIGVATGADSAFIGPFAALDVEADRKVPLV